MKKLKWIILLLLILAIIFISIKRWKAWFGNPVEPPYSSLSEPGRIQLTFGSKGSFSRNISWQCGDSLMPSLLIYTKEQSNDTLSAPASGEMLLTTGGTTVSYHAGLTELTEGIYNYAVRTGGKQSEWYSFNVANPDTAFTFVYLGDIQDTINGITDSFVSHIRSLQPRAAFWVLGGDIIERPQDRYWNEYFTSMDSVSQTIPIIACPGNHEYVKGITRKLENRFIYTFSYFIESQYKEHAVFDLRYGNTAIITLDSNRDPWTLFSQRSWFKEALERAQDAEWKIVVIHHPIHSIRGKMNNFVVRTMFNSLISEYGVDLVLQGHEHGYARMISKDKNGDLKTPVYVVGQASPKDYRLYFNEKYDRFGSGLRFYHTVNVYQDSLIFKTFTKNNELYDAVSLKKEKDKISVSDNGKKIPEQIGITPRNRLKKGEREKYEKEILNRKEKILNSL
jgi:hypothetical protein